MKSQQIRDNKQNTPIEKVQKLSIQISLNGLSFCVLDVLNHKITELSHISLDAISNPLQLEEKLHKIYESDDTILKQSFEEVSVSHVNNLSTFVPTALFSDKNLSDYLKYNTKILPNDFITHDEIHNGDIMNVYVPYVNINNFFFEKYGAFHYKHFSSVLVEQLLQLPKNSEEANVYVHVQETHFEIIVLKGKKLLFYNSFEYETPQDFMYYVLFMIEQLALNPDQIPLHLLGEIEKEDALYELLYTYIRNVDFVEKNYAFSLDEEIAIDHSYKDFTLLSSL